MAGRAFKLLVKNASQVVAVCANKELFLIGERMNQPVIYENASVIIDHQGLIEAVGESASILEQYKDASFDQVIDATGLSIVPGLVDGHTHPVWAGDRVHEFAMKLAGATYMEIHQKGGGIGFTVRHTKNASDEELLASLRTRLHKALLHGTTLLEAKTGYGLELDTEMKLLRILHQANVVREGHPLIPDIVSTYLAAHSVPPGKTAREAADDIIHNQIPVLKELRDKGEISPSNIDVFFEKGVFEVAETRDILLAGKEAGLELNYHGDEINPMHSGELAHELHALAVSHLEKVSPEGIAGMAQVPTFAVLLPSTAYILRLEPPPARAFITGNVPVALGSDFNPNAHCISMPLIMNFACVLLRMTMNEVLVAATINAAGSLKKSDLHGSIEKGKYGNLVIVNAPNWEHLVYQIGEPPIAHVVYKGDVVHH